MEEYIHFRVSWKITKKNKLTIEKIQKLLGSKEEEKHYGLKIGKIQSDDIVAIGWRRTLDRY